MTGNWETSLDVRDPQCVAFLPNADVSQACATFVRSQSVHLRLLLTGLTQPALFHDQPQDSIHSGQVLLPQELSQVRGKNSTGGNDYRFGGCSFF